MCRYSGAQFFDRLQCTDVQNPMLVRDCFDLDRRLDTQFADDLRYACESLGWRFTVLRPRQSISRSNTLVQDAACDRPVRHTVVNNVLGIFRHRVRVVGFIGTRKRAVAEGPEPNEEQKKGMHIETDLCDNFALRDEVIVRLV